MINFCFYFFLILTFLCYNFPVHVLAKEFVILSKYQPNTHSKANQNTANKYTKNGNVMNLTKWVFSTYAGKIMGLKISYFTESTKLLTFRLRVVTDMRNVNSDNYGFVVRTPLLKR